MTFNSLIRNGGTEAHYVRRRTNHAVLSLPHINATLNRRGSIDWHIMRRVAVYTACNKGTLPGRVL